MAKKSALIEEIIKLTEVDGLEYFDNLEDKTERYLTKMLKVCKGL